MADDDAGDWFADAADEPPPPPLIKKKQTKEQVVKEAVAEQLPPESAQDLLLEEEDYLDPDKLILFKHWIRPKFLQYKYIYDYRYNYYNDVIDYLDKRQKGFLRDIPRPQTWAERALRTYNSYLGRKSYFKDAEEDTKLCTKIRLGTLFHLYHSREYFNRKYATLI